MRFLLLLVVLSYVIAKYVGALNLSSSPAATVAVDLTTPPPRVPSAHELRRRESAWNTCGSKDEWGAITCNEPSLVCKGTILSNSQAYQYCSTKAAEYQWVPTTGISNCDETQYTQSAVCCSADKGYMREVLFIASPYTVTGFSCFTEPNARPPSTITYSPASNVSNPSQYKISLARLKASASKASAHKTVASSEHVKSNSGLSSGTQIRIGVGVGIGVGTILILIITGFCWERNSRKRQREDEEKDARLEAEQKRRAEEEERRAKEEKRRADEQKRREEIVAREALEASHRSSENSHSQPVSRPAPTYVPQQRTTPPLRRTGRSWPTVCLQEGDITSDSAGVDVGGDWSW